WATRLPARKGLSPPRREILLARAKFERFFQVSPELLDGLQADAQAEQPGRHPLRLPAGAGLEQGVDAAEARRVGDELQRGLDLARLLGAGHVERQQPPEARIAHVLDRWMLLQTPGELGGGVR